MQSVSVNVKSYKLKKSKLNYAFRGIANYLHRKMIKLGLQSSHGPLFK
jgi:hypothetical protein